MKSPNFPKCLRFVLPSARPRTARERGQLFVRRFFVAFFLIFAMALALNGQTLLVAEQNPAPVSKKTSPQTPERPSAPRKLFDVADTNLPEISGFAASLSYPGFWWAHNDSGDTARLFLLDSLGKTVATVSLQGVEARDWEDMAASGGYLYLADIGDNFRVMENVTIHRIWEPKIDVSRLGQLVSMSVSEVETAKVVYPDGAHDAEALAVGPDGTFLIVSKHLKGSNFYVSQTPFRRGVVALKPIRKEFALGGESLFSKMATAGDLSRDGKKLAVSTYTQLYEFRLSTPFDLETLDFSAPHIQDLPTLRQCESAAYNLAGTEVVVSSEGKKPPVFALKSGRDSIRAAFP